MGGLVRRARQYDGTGAEMMTFMKWVFRFMCVWVAIFCDTPMICVQKKATEEMRREAESCFVMSCTPPALLHLKTFAMAQRRNLSLYSHGPTGDQITLRYC